MGSDGEAQRPAPAAAGDMLPIGALLAHHAAQDANKPAVTLGETTVAYAELDARSNRKARQLQALGVGEGDVVTIAAPKSLEIYETLFAIWKLGASPNPVSVKLPTEELKAIVALAKPRLVIGPEGFELGGAAFLASAPAPESFSAEPFPSHVAPHWKIMTSGGSTGRPKLIVDKKPGLYDPGFSLLGFLPGDTVLNPGPVYHNAPFSVVSNTLFTGGHVIEMERFDALRALELIEERKVSAVNFVPTMMHRIWRLPPEQRDRFDLSSLRLVFHMASACPVWLKQAWIDWLGPEKIYELYGGTEAQGATVISGIEWLERRGSVGKVLPGAQMRVIGENGEVCAPGEIGEIYFLPDGGKGSTYEYVGAEAKSDGAWESIGDLGYMDEDGYLYLADRRTDLIVSGGANVFPAEVEAALDEHPAVLSSVAIGLPDDDLGQKVHAIVQLSPAAQGVDAAALSTYLSEKLVRYKIPRSFEFVDEKLRDDAGKVRRSQLREARISAA